MSQGTEVVGFHAGLSSSQLTAHSVTFLFLEEAAPDAAGSTNDSYYDPRNDHASARHRGGANAAFCDAHVGWLRTNAFTYPQTGARAQFDP